MTVAELTVDRFAAGGDGIGRIESPTGSVAVFVPRSAPGDRVRVSLDIRKRFARGTIEEILIPSAARAEPLCYHYRVDRCGGCQLQHVQYPAQLEAKRAIIRDAIVRIGKRDADLPPIEPSAQQWRYRRKLTLALKRMPDGKWKIGLHPYDDPAAVFQLADCPITDERVLSAWREVMDASRHYPPADELRASVRLLSDEGSGVSVVMEGGNSWPSRTAFLEAVPLAEALWWKPAHRARTLVAERSGLTASASFAQVNTEVGRALHEYVLNATRRHRPRTVVDAYAGSGATAIPLSRDGILVVAIESDGDAAAYCASQLAVGSRSMTANVEDAIAATLPADVVLVNPPRVGLHERVTAVLQGAADPPRAVIYVSCDPATLARDLTRLPRYRIASTQAFDMFPNTAHVETVCELVPMAS